MQWNSAAQRVNIALDGVSMGMTINKELPGFGAAPVIRESRTLIPIRYIDEKMNANVLWLPKEQKIIIVK